ncbi:hypothetical protein PIIN_10808 [Serendipita indica DSM 11827]|uniref:Uncharacterized protein n=1 Tax=Serendipita indica (strain DSM 11827) TaxID=1109443 RepID=G4TZS9_SERID|nr:hypothetical protein PIIN_10808 [Serendipita indica DSM 11827]
MPATRKGKGKAKAKASANTVTQATLRTTSSPLNQAVRKGVLSRQGACVIRPDEHERITIPVPDPTSSNPAAIRTTPPAGSSHTDTRQHSQQHQDHHRDKNPENLRGSRGTHDIDDCGDNENDDDDDDNNNDGAFLTPNQVPFRVVASIRRKDGGNDSEGDEDNEDKDEDEEEAELSDRSYVDVAGPSRLAVPLRCMSQEYRH